MKKVILNVKKLLILFFVLIFVPLFPQSFTEITEGGWGQGTNRSKPAVADIDNDGLLDLLTGDYDGTLRHYEQSAQGSETFDLVTRKFCDIDIRRYSAPTFTDLDHDGLLDLLIGDTHGRLYHYEQSSQGSDSFDLVSESFNDIQITHMATPTFTDLDNNGRLDLLIGHYTGTLYHYEQSSQGSTTFDLVTESFNGIDVGDYSAPTFTDLDSDGRLDLIIGDSYGKLHHYKQSSEYPDSFNLVSETFTNTYVGHQAVPTFTDLDHDGRLDLLIGETDGMIFHYEQSSSNTQKFDLRTMNLLNIIDVGFFAKPTVLDLDQNGLLDLLIGESDGNIFHYEQSSEYTTSFIFKTGNFSNINIVSYSAPTFTDLNHDGKLDLLIGDFNGRINHYEQTALGTASLFVLKTRYFNRIDVGYHSAPIITDLDRNGKLDLLIGEKDGNINHYEQSALSSRLILRTETFNDIDVGAHSAPTFTDLDHDGRLDLVIGDYDGKLPHYEQSSQGSTSFDLVTETFNGIDCGDYNSVPFFADINGDGWEDLLVGSGDGGVHLFLRNPDNKINNKTSNFTENTELKSIADNANSDEELTSIQSQFELLQNYPNPFKSETTIEYTLPEELEVTLRIYDLSGQVVRTFYTQTLQNAGNHTIQWDGTNNSGEKVTGGLYLIHIRTGAYTSTKKVYLMK